MSAVDTDNTEHLRAVLAEMPDHFDVTTIRRVGAELDRGEDKAAAEILAADLDAHRPTVTKHQMTLLYRAIFWNRRFLDETRYPHLVRHSYILYELPTISRGDGDAPPWTFSDFRRALTKIIEQLAGRLHPVSLDHARSLFHHGEEFMALNAVAASLDGDPAPVTREEWETLRRLLLFDDVDQLTSSEGYIARGEDILAALPVIDS